MTFRGAFFVVGAPGTREKHLVITSVHVRLKAEMFGAKTPRLNNLP